MTYNKGVTMIFKGDRQLTPALTDLLDDTTPKNNKTYSSNKINSENDALNTAIADETTRATTKENELNTAISDEVTRATNKETELETTIETKSTVKIFYINVNVGSIPADSSKDVRITFNLTDNNCPSENTIGCQRGTTPREIYLKRINTYKSGSQMIMVITFTNTASFQIDNISTTIQYLQIK